MKPREEQCCENCHYFGLHPDGHRFIRGGYKCFCIIMGDCISGHGHCSEWEEFPIAVTKRHFPEE